MMKRLFLSAVLLCLALSAFSTAPPQPIYPIPSPQQKAWQELEYVGFIHFGINTFTDREWGDGTEDPDQFNPTEFDATQWVDTFKKAGINMLILTCKHHDGFCLWPSEYTEHSVKTSAWKDGMGDVVRDVADACHAAGIKFGVYLSPWDRNHPEYGNSPVYNEYFRNQLTELLTEYAPVDEVWFDGANGEGPNGKRQEYDWLSYYSLIRRLAPNAVIAIMGQDIRWVGNESGVAKETEWSVRVIPEGDDVHPQFTMNGSLVEGSYRFLDQEEDDERTSGGLVWFPSESDVSIRPGWFYHADQDDDVKTLDHLLDIYYKSIGRNSVLLLNLPPDTRGLIHENDVERLIEFRNAIDETYAHDLSDGASARASEVRGNDDTFAASRVLDDDPHTYWAVDDGQEQGVLEITLPQARTFDVVLLQEPIELGQRVAEFHVEAKIDGEWEKIAEGTTIGYKRLLRIEPVTASAIRVSITKSRGCPLIHTVGLFKQP